MSVCIFFDMFVTGDMFHMMTCLLSLFAMFWHVCLFHIVTCVCCVSLLSLWPFSTRLTLITPYPGSGENCLTLYVQNGVPHCLILFDIVFPHIVDCSPHCLTLFEIVQNVVLHCSPRRWQKSHIVIWFVSPTQIFSIAIHCFTWYIVETALKLPYSSADSPNCYICRQLSNSTHE